MYGILVSALNTALGFIFKQVIIKFVVLFALFFIISEFVTVLAGFIPSPTSLTNSLGNIPSDIWYFLDIFAFSQGAPLVITAMVYRFLIRRIPVIG